METYSGNSEATLNSWQIHVVTDFFFVGSCVCIEVCLNQSSGYWLLTTAEVNLLQTMGYDCINEILASFQYFSVSLQNGQ